MLRSPSVKDSGKELLGVARKLSFFALTMLGAIGVLSVYIIQRGAEMMASDTLEHFDSMDNQYGVYHLNFAYGTLTVGWPFVLGGGCLLFTILVKRREEVWTAFDRAEEGAALPELDAFRMDLSSFAGVKWAVRLIRALPIVAIAVHAAAPLIPTVIGYLEDTHPGFSFYSPDTFRSVALYALSIIGCVFAVSQWGNYRSSVMVFAGLRRPEQTE